MFLSSPLLLSSADTARFENVRDIRVASRLALNEKLNEAMSFENEDEALKDGVSNTTSFSQVMASVQGQGRGQAEGSKSQKALGTFSSLLNGDYLSSFKLDNPTPADKVAEPQGMARASFVEYSPEGERRERVIDKSSVLYEKALELESYFVKIMTQSMRATLSSNTLSGEESFASKMYKDMMYDELNRRVTKNAGFGLADHIYLQLNREACGKDSVISPKNE